MPVELTDDRPSRRARWCLRIVRWGLLGIALLALLGCDNPISPERLSDALGCEIETVRLGCWHTCPTEATGVSAQRVCP